MDFSVEGVISVESIPILRTVIVSLKDRVWLPSLIVKVSVICGESTSFRLSLQPFVSLPVGGI